MGANNLLELLVVEGPLKGRKFQVQEAGLRLGRSSSCDISVTDDMALSRDPRHSWLALCTSMLPAVYPRDRRANT
jgi:hypothetical protein